MFLESFVLNRGKIDPLAMKHTSELLTIQVSLAEGVVILEELEQTDAILLHNLLNLGHEGEMILLTIKIDKLVTES